MAEGVEMHIRKTAVGGVITSAFDKKNNRKAAKKEEAPKKDEAPKAEPESKPAEVAEAPAADASKAEGIGEGK